MKNREVLRLRLLKPRPGDGCIGCRRDGNFNCLAETETHVPCADCAWQHDRRAKRATTKTG